MKIFFDQISVPLGAYKIETLNIEIERIIVDAESFTAAKYPFTTKPNFSTLGSIIKVSTQWPKITFAPDDSIVDLLGFNMSAIFKKYIFTYSCKYIIIW